MIYRSNTSHALVNLQKQSSTCHSQKRAWSELAEWLPFRFKDLMALFSLRSCWKEIISSHLKYNVYKVFLFLDMKKIAAIPSAQARGYRSYYTKLKTQSFVRRVTADVRNDFCSLISFAVPERDYR